MSHLNRDIMITVADKEKEISAEDVMETLIKYCDLIQIILDDQFKNQELSFHVTIKGHVDMLNVKTLARDTDLLTSNDLRTDPILFRKNNHIIPIEENTSLDSLRNFNNKVFACDDLTSYPNFNNISENWESKYNCTLVVPIRKNYNIKIIPGKFELSGFIGVDCMKEEKSESVFMHENNNTKIRYTDLMLTFADTLYGIMKKGKIAYENERDIINESYSVDNTNYKLLENINEWLLKKYPDRN